MNNTENIVKKNKTGIILPALLILVLAVSVGISLAFISAKTESAVNTFTQSMVSCEVLEDYFDGISKEQVQIKNTGNTDAYIRAAVVATWLSDDGTGIYGVKPIENQDYYITYSSDSGWEKAADGFWYYTLPVAANAETEELIESCSIIDGKAPSGYHLSIEIVASAIQASPTSVAAEQWKSGVDSVNKTELVIKEAQ